MPSGRPSGTLFSAQSLLWVSLPVSFALPGRVEAENLSPRGPEGVSGGPRESSKIDSKSLSVPIGGLRRAGGTPRVPAGHPGCIFMHIYACIYAHSCIFMHIYAYLCMYLCVFMHIHAYLCIFHACVMLMHAYSCIFMHIYLHVRICLTQGTYIYC